MALTILTTLENIVNEYPTAETWADAGGDYDQYEALVECERTGMPVTINCLATDGYYDIILPDGEIVDAISFYHLSGVNINGIDLSSVY